MPPGADGIAHGGRLLAARALFPGAPEPFIDLSTGINPHPYPFAPPPAASFNRLPEAEQELALRAIAAIRFGAPDADAVAAAPGSQLLISLLPLLLRCGRAAILSPTYAGHTAGWRAFGASVREVVDPAALLAAAGPETALVLCNPNNPDGRRLPGGVIADLARRVGARGGYLVVDQAFADLEPELDDAAALLPAPGLVVLRSFGKAYGLGGLRLGFLLSAPELAARTRRLLGPWAVGGPALAIGGQALGDADWVRDMTATLEAASRRLDRLLARAGLVAAGGTRLFRLAESDRAGDWFTALGRRGILVRRFEERPCWLRFGLPGDEAAWRRLEEALF